MKKISKKHGVALLAIALANFNLSAQDGGDGATSELKPLDVIGSQAEAPALSSWYSNLLGLVQDIPKHLCRNRRSN